MPRFHVVVVMSNSDQRTIAREESQWTAAHHAEAIHKASANFPHRIREDEQMLVYVEQATDEEETALDKTMRHMPHWSWPKSLQDLAVRRAAAHYGAEGAAWSDADEEEFDRQTKAHAEHLAEHGPGQPGRPKPD